MRKGFEYFDKVFLINLEKRTDRLQQCNDIFKELNILDLVERFPAIKRPQAEYDWYISDGKKIKIGEYGCIASHISIIKMAKANGWKSVLVLEDDVKFVNHKYFNDSVEQLKEHEWDLFYLGSNTHIPLDKVNSNLLKLKEGFATHAIAYHERFYDKLIKAFDKKAIEIIDVWLAENGQENGNAYCTYPITAIQENSFSDIHNQVIDYSWMITKFEDNTKHLK
ncbi:MAG: glycosyltransferase family 25 protein [bacterium]|jgi:glycosyl transferase family 25|tara:strand:+ start:5323 stop:5991 length:669 start_codon:yes stop_codon:yes gene_type:complete